MSEGTKVPYDEEVRPFMSEVRIPRWPVIASIVGAVVAAALNSADLHDEAMGVASMTGLLLLVGLSMGEDVGLEIERKRAEIATLKRRLKEAEARLAAKQDTEST